MAKIQLTSETSALDRRKPGYALLKISGWKHNPEQTQMSIQSSEDEKFLGVEGLWEPNPVWHSLSNMNLAADSVLQGDVGPALVDPIVNSPNNSYRVTLKSDAESEVRTLRVDSDVLASSASGSAPDSSISGKGLILEEFVSDPPATEEQEIPEVPEVPEPEVDAGHEIITTETVSDPIVSDINTEPGFASRNKTILIILLLLILLALVAGAAWYYKWLPGSGHLDNNHKTASGGISSNPAASVITPNPVTPKLNDMELLQQFLATKPSTDAILAKAKEWINTGHCKAMLKMMVYSGHKSNDPRIALEYAKMYDPNLFNADGCIEKSDKDTAVYWYQKSIEAGNADAKSYLEKL